LTSLMKTTRISTCQGSRVRTIITQTTSSSRHSSNKISMGHAAPSSSCTTRTQRTQGTEETTVQEASNRSRHNSLTPTMAGVSIIARPPLSRQISSNPPREVQGVTSSTVSRRGSARTRKTTLRRGISSAGPRGGTGASLQDTAVADLDLVQMICAVTSTVGSSTGETNTGIIEAGHMVVIRVSSLTTTAGMRMTMIH